MLHSLCGGTGSGLGCHIASKVKETFGEKIMCNYSLFPSENMSEIVLEPYNVALSVPILIESSDFIFTLDNKALSKICATSVGMKETDYKCMNEQIAAGISGVTTCLRFPGQLNSDLIKLSVNLIPFPTLHFLVTSHQPNFNYIDKKTLTGIECSVPKILDQLFDSNYLMVSCIASQGKYLAASVIFRGIVSTMEIEEELMKIQTKQSDRFVDWLPSNVSIGVCDIAPPGKEICGTLAGNSTTIKHCMESVVERCSNMLDQKAFLHWYIEEGLTADDITSALQKIKNLTEEYLSFEENVDNVNGTDKT